ncbi:MAG TPA: hypothetical protein VHK90_13025, partial [Thermoanaerobaculia bacterium]|nr:hypothetical protein [Thermoanaerobaculia bacterium]
DLQYLRDHFSETGVVTPIREKQTLATRVKKRWPVAAAVVVALLAGSLLTAWVRRAEPRVITSERYLTYSGHDYSPAVSPDGKLIAFASSRDGVQRIWLKQIAGGSEVALTKGIDDFPRFSPDGSSIIYVHADQPGQPGSLWRVPVVGGEARRLVDQVLTADLSPDGTKLAFTRNVQEPNNAYGVLLIADADGSNVKELARTDVGAVHPRWSPDGKWIAVVATRGGRVTQAVLLVDPRTGETKTLSSPPKAGEVSSVVWSADGRHIFYVRAESVEAVVGSSAKLIRHDVGSDLAEAIGWTSHNGTVLDVLGDGQLVLDVRSPRDNLREVLNGGIAESEERWITRGNSSDRQPSYSPDGKSVLFSSNRSGNLDLWISNADGGVRRVTDDGAEDWDPAFTPDGKKIVWSSGRSGNLEIWIANADGSEAKQISRDGVDAENPTATRDGWVVYNSFNPKKAGLWKVRMDGTRATQIVKGRTALPEVSPDGQYVAFLSQSRTANAEIRVVRISDGQDMGFAIRSRGTRRTSAILGRSRWMPDGKAIAFLGQNEEGVNGVFVQDFVPNTDTSATRRPLGGFDRERATESFGIAPDGMTMTVAGWEQLFSLFSIEGVPEVTKGKKENRT